MPTERFTRQEFEEALHAAREWKNVTPQGLKQGEYSYALDFGSPHTLLELRSSIDATGIARDTGDDSIRAWMISKDGKPLGGKVQNYVTRQKNWRTNMANMLNQLVRLAAWIQPCPQCDTLMRLALRKKDKEVFLFCPQDAQNKDNPAHERHVDLTVIDWNTGQEQEQEETPLCPTCQEPLRRVKIKNGRNAGKEALSCPQKDANGKFLNHFFQVIEDDAR